jgi:hypothetical protein
MRNWTEYLVERRECLRITWTARLLVGVSLLLVLWLASTVWVWHVARALVCQESVEPRADVILVENFDPHYLVFERAAELLNAGRAERVLVPTNASPDPEKPNLVSAGIVELMAGVARLPAPEILPIRYEEPVSLNAAYQIRGFLQKEGAKSVIVVAPGFRSRRSLLVYASVFEEAGIEVSCSPVFGLHTPKNWTHTWHGIQDVVLQYAKLQYYRLYVLPHTPDQMASDWVLRPERVR